jgi:hypothetical protein
MTRTQRIRLLASFDGLPVRWHEYFVHRDHAWDEGHVACSELLVCPKCTTTWATLQFLDDDLAWPRSQFCQYCGLSDEWHPVPGSLLVEEGWGVIDTALLSQLPPELVTREFNLHLKAYS